LKPGQHLIVDTAIAVPTRTVVMLRAPGELAIQEDSAAVVGGAVPIFLCARGPRCRRDRPGGRSVAGRTAIAPAGEAPGSPLAWSRAARGVWDFCMGQPALRRRRSLPHGRLKDQ